MRSVIVADRSMKPVAEKTSEKRPLPADLVANAIFIYNEYI